MVSDLYVPICASAHTFTRSDLLLKVPSRSSSHASFKTGTGPPHTHTHPRMMLWRRTADTSNREAQSRSGYTSHVHKHTRAEWQRLKKRGRGIMMHVFLHTPANQNPTDEITAFQSRYLWVCVIYGFSQAAKADSLAEASIVFPWAAPRRNLVLVAVIAEKRTVFSPISRDLDERWCTWLSK